MILTRDTAIPVLANLTVVLITSTIRNLPTEVRLGPEDGLDYCVINCDNIYTIPKEDLDDRRRGHLSTQKLNQLREALMTALGLDFVV